MIRLDVSVVDGGGRPIRGLVAENFSILENGKPVEVSVFEAIEDGSLATMAASEDGGPASLAVLAQGPLSHSPGQRIVIVADPSDLTPMQLARVREATSDFIAKQAKDGDIVRMINLATREVWEGRIPDDRLRLASIGKVMSRRRSPFFRPGGAGESLGEQIEFDMEDDVNGAYTESLRRERFQSRFARTGELLSLFDEILIQLAAIPGRKSLILISDGFPQLRLMDERLERTAHLAREAQAAIHFIDAYGLDGLLPEPGQKMESIFDKAWNRSGGSQDLAQATGGFVSRFANVLTSAVSRAAEEARSYYIVGYAPTRRDDGKFRSVKVRVDREDATVRTKKGYIAGGVSSGLVSRRVH
ncbi:MAG: VWA domain-containing protein [Vicinamibacteria bacterium]|nr:VWA domain-containing protein [Vicinamibacteria bacterium]